VSAKRCWFSGTVDIRTVKNIAPKVFLQIFAEPLANWHKRGRECMRDFVIGVAGVA